MLGPNTVEQRSISRRCSDPQGSVPNRLVTRLPPVGHPRTTHQSQPLTHPAMTRGWLMDTSGGNRLLKSPHLSSSSGSQD